MKRWMKIIGAGLLSAIAAPCLCILVIGFIRFVKGIGFGGEMDAWDITAGVLVMLIVGSIGAFIYSIDEE